MLWLKSLHIIFVVCWFAGLFYLPRIFVYYAGSEHSETRQQLAVMARKLYRFVTPLMVLAIVFGLAMIAMNPDYYLRATWMWIKLAGVAFLLVYHLQCGRYVKRINADTDNHSHVFYRFFNEVPVIFLFLIVILVVLKPF
jgi:protoporphyrinogen IX oxidase